MASQLLAHSVTHFQRYEENEVEILHRAKILQTDNRFVFQPIIVAFPSFDLVHPPQPPQEKKEEENEVEILPMAKILQTDIPFPLTPTTAELALSDLPVALEHARAPLG